jgi:hypothetical protein|tara:strand:+ start:468 stop:761 length:294 start_codon:yes stop_codon:yes gene_type:complete
MTEYKDKVKHQGKLIRLETWRKGIKMILDEKIHDDMPWKMRIVFNDDSETLEWSNTNHKQYTPCPHSEEDLIDMMENDEHEYQRKLFKQRRDYETTI